MILDECQNNYRAARLYSERFPVRCHPNHVIIRRFTLRAHDGHLACRKFDEKDPRVVSVLAAVHLDPQISNRIRQACAMNSRVTSLRTV